MRQTVPGWLKLKISGQWWLWQKVLAGDDNHYPNELKAFTGMVNVCPFCIDLFWNVVVFQASFIFLLCLCLAKINCDTQNFPITTARVNALTTVMMTYDAIGQAPVSKVPQQTGWGAKQQQLLYLRSLTNFLSERILLMNFCFDINHCMHGVVSMLRCMAFLLIWCHNYWLRI